MKKLQEVNRMLKFEWERFKDKVPYISDNKLEEYAEEVIRDYRPINLKKPVPIDHLHFLKRYLKLSCHFADIYFNGDDPILGATSFNDNEELHIFNAETRRKDRILLKRGEVVLDKILLEDIMSTKLTFTGLHEGCHWFLHQEFFTKEKIICCRSGSIDNRERRQFQSPIDFLEHQANYFASALAMPKIVMGQTAEKWFFEKKISFPLRAINLTTYFLEEELVQYISKVFQISKPAAMYRLIKLGYLFHDEDYELLKSVV